MQQAGPWIRQWWDGRSDLEKDVRAQVGVVFRFTVLAQVKVDTIGALEANTSNGTGRAIVARYPTVQEAVFSK